MAACPLCTAPIADGAERCPSCHVPFTSAAPVLPGLEARAPRAMIPTPPASLGATRPTPLAAQLPPQPPPPPPARPTTSTPPEPWQAQTTAGQAATETAPAYALGTASAQVTGLTLVTPATRPWWRDPRVLVGAPAVLVAVIVGWLLLTTGDVERVTVPVPSVAGTDSLDAKTLLERAGFVVPFAGTGTVVGQDPAPGEDVAVGTAVVLTVEPYPAPPAPAPAASGSRAPTTPGG